MLVEHFTPVVRYAFIPRNPIRPARDGKLIEFVGRCRLDRVPELLDLVPDYGVTV